jgi:hypothetical protein
LRLNAKFHRIGRRQCDKRVRPGLLEAEPGVAENIEQSDRDGEAPQAADPFVAVPGVGHRSAL